MFVSLSYMVLHKMIPHVKSQVTFSNLPAAILSISTSVKVSILASFMAASKAELYCKNWEHIHQNLSAKLKSETGLICLCWRHV